MKKNKQQQTADAEKFPIAAWGGTREELRTEEYYESLRQAGFTMITDAQPEELDQAEKHGLKLIVHLKSDAWKKTDAELKKEFTALYEKIGSHPALAGYFMKDEPGASLFPWIARYRRLIRKIDPEREGYINLFPSYASPWQLETATYREYLERYIETTKPDFIGYDYYDLMEDGPNLVGIGYWENLALFRELSQKYKIPFRFILLSVAHFDFREVSEADISFQAFSALAYGAKGLEYFTYSTPDIGNFRRAPLDTAGLKTPTWYYAAAVNNRIQALAPVLNKLESTVVYHFSSGDRQLPPNSKPGGSSLIAENPGREILVGEFIHPETQWPYMLIVNKELYHSVYLNFKLREPDKWVVQRISPAIRGKISDFNWPHMWMAPGGAVLLKLTPADQFKDK